jgi:hypothetical protein
MKKTYVRPEVYFESFELSASIATGCKLISNAAERVCPVTDNELGITYFASDMCTYGPPKPNDKVCYNPPADTANVFTS